MRHTSGEHIFLLLQPMGGSLEDLLESSHGRLHEEFVRARVVRPVLSALSYVHDAHRMIHRAVHPSSIFYVGEQFYLGNFCLSLSLFKSPARSVVGSLPFLAPELLELSCNQEPDNAYSPKDSASLFTDKIDLWALAVTVYWALYATLPYRGATPREILVAQIETNPLAIPPRRGEALSDDCLDFLQRCFTTDPHRRPPPRELLRCPWLDDGQEVADYRPKQIRFDNVPSFASEEAGGRGSASYAARVRLSTNGGGVGDLSALAGLSVSASVAGKGPGTRRKANALPGNNLDSFASVASGHSYGYGYGCDSGLVTSPLASQSKAIGSPGLINDRSSRGSMQAFAMAEAFSRSSETGSGRLSSGSGLRGSKPSRLSGGFGALNGSGSQLSHLRGMMGAPPMSVGLPHPRSGIMMGGAPHMGTSERSSHSLAPSVISSHSSALGSSMTGLRGAKAASRSSSRPGSFSNHGVSSVAKTAVRLPGPGPSALPAPILAPPVRGGEFPSAVLGPPSPSKGSGTNTAQLFLRGSRPRASRLGLPSREGSRDGSVHDGGSSAFSSQALTEEVGVLIDEDDVSGLGRRTLDPIRIAPSPAAFSPERGTGAMMTRAALAATALPSPLSEAARAKPGLKGNHTNVHASSSFGPDSDSIHDGTSGTRSAQPIRIGGRASAAGSRCSHGTSVSTPRTPTSAQRTATGGSTLVVDESLSMPPMVDEALRALGLDGPTQHPLEKDDRETETAAPDHVLVHVASDAASDARTNMKWSIEVHRDADATESEPDVDSEEAADRIKLEGFSPRPLAESSAGTQDDLLKVEISGPNTAEAPPRKRGGFFSCCFGGSGVVH